VLELSGDTVVLESPADRRELSVTLYTMEAAMLAEMYLLQLETLMRVSEEATRAENSRFVPFTPASFRNVQIRADEKKQLEK